MSSKDDELIMCVPQSRVTALNVRQGFHSDGLLENQILFDQIVHPFYANFRRRGDVENDPKWKQIIPCVMIKDCDGRVFSYQRAPTSGELRLHGQYDIMVGGHINTNDRVTGCGGLIETLVCNIYYNALWRELHEEFGLQPKDFHSPGLVGFVNDDSNSVGQVHLGCVHVFTCHRKNLVPSTDEHTDARFRGVDEIEGLFNSLNKWSQMVYDALLNPATKIGG